MGKCDLGLGNIIVGKWNQRHYKILSKLGEGGIGAVYRVVDLDSGTVCALKISSDMQSITKEYEKLRDFQQLDAIPTVGELDDWVQNEEKMHFFSMEYIRGCDLKKYIRSRKISIQTVIGITLIIGGIFSKFHQRGYVFGDLKLENLMLDEVKGSIRIIDLGGVTAMGKGIKEFTPLYDRASWNMGLRRADEAYDLFSLNMLLAFLLLGEKMPNISHGIERVRDGLVQAGLPSPLLRLMEKVLYQKKVSMNHYLKQLRKLYDQRLAFDHRYRISIRDLRINLVLGGSIFLFLLIIWFSFGKLSLS